MPRDIIDIEEGLPHEVAEVLCLCGHRWIAVYPEQTLLKDLECPKCHETGKVFKTGQDIEQESEVTVSEEYLKAVMQKWSENE